MFTILLISFFIIFETSLVNCMEPQKSSNERLTKKKSKILTLSRKTSNDKTIDEKNAITYTIQQEHPFIIATHTAILSNDYTAIKFHLSNPHLNPNMQDQNGYPALHLFAQAKNYEGIKILLDDYRIDVSIQDIDQKRISDYLNKNKINGIDEIDRIDGNLSRLRQELFARHNLDIVTYEKCRGIKSFYDRCLITHAFITEVIEQIKHKINHDRNQSDQEVPQSAKFPEYATDEFITKKIWFILSSLQGI